MQRPYICPYAYSILIPLFTQIIATASITLLLLLLCCYYCYNIVTTDQLCQASLLSGAAELTIQLLSLIFILWLPLHRTNKFGFYFPRRLLRSLILVGHHRPRSPCTSLRFPWRRCSEDLPRSRSSARRRGGDLP